MKPFASFVLNIEGSLMGTTTLDQSGPWGNDNERILHIPQKYMTGVSSSDGLASYLEHSFVQRSYPAAKWPSAYSTVPADWAAWFQMFSSNTNNLHIVLWLQIVLPNANNLHTL